MAFDFTSLGNNSPNFAKAAQTNERRRQGIINLGTDQINSVFRGGTSPFFSIPQGGEDFRFSGQEFGNIARGDQSLFTLNNRGTFVPFFVPRRADPSAIVNNASQGAKAAAIAGLPPSIGSKAGAIIGGIQSGDFKGAIKHGIQSSFTGGLSDLFGGGDDPPTPRELTNIRLRQGLLFSEPNFQTFEGFQEPFFKERAQAFEKFALPQFADQFQQAREAQAFGLANRGLSNSSVSRLADSRLQRTATRGKQNITDQGLEQANSLRRDIEAARQTALNQLFQTADPSRATASAIDAAAGFRIPSTFAPIANIFGDLANQFAINQSLNSFRPGGGNVGGGNNSNFNLSGALGPVSF